MESPKIADVEMFDDVCWNCGGEGYVPDECSEDTCCCLDPEEEHGYSPCPICKGGA